MSGIFRGTVYSVLDLSGTMSIQGRQIPALTRGVVFVVVIGLLAASCIGPGSGGDNPEAAGSLSDASTIWCNENRWQVVARASQLQFEVPPTNPSEAEIVMAAWETFLDIDADKQLGKISIHEALQLVRDNNEARREAKARFESGEWHKTGVQDPEWIGWQIDSQDAYVRSCAAAYELDGGGRARR